MGDSIQFLLARESIGSGSPPCRGFISGSSAPFQAFSAAGSTSGSNQREFGLGDLNTLQLCINSKFAHLLVLHTL